MVMVSLQLSPGTKVDHCSRSLEGDCAMQSKVVPLLSQGEIDGKDDGDGNANAIHGTWCKV